VTVRHGVHIPANERDLIAARSLEIYEQAESQSAAFREIEVRFDVSRSTARNLVSRGRWLRRQAP
jgi:hypothetical protein